MWWLILVVNLTHLERQNLSGGIASTRLAYENICWGILVIAHWCRHVQLTAGSPVFRQVNLDCKKNGIWTLVWEQVSKSLSCMVSASGPASDFTFIGFLPLLSEQWPVSWTEAFSSPSCVGQGVHHSKGYQSKRSCWPSSLHTYAYTHGIDT